MARVSRSVAPKAAPEAVRAVIGGFRALPGWRPAVASSKREEAGGVERRRLALHGEIPEDGLGAGPHACGCRILSGPPPVADYVTVLTAAPAGGDSVVAWRSTFAPAAPDAEAVIGGVCDAGLAERFGRA
jgi:hypothetical protein